MPWHDRGGRRPGRADARAQPFAAGRMRAKLRTASGRMPVYTAALVTDAQIADIVAYLQSIPTGKSAKDIPLLNR